MNIELDLLQFQSQLRSRTENGKHFLFDPIRKKYLIRTPEELVRQLMILYLTQTNKYPIARIAVEKELLIHERQKRFDLLIYNDAFKPFILIECKAPSIKLSDATFRQASAYNFALKADYLVITNGIQTHCCCMDYKEKSYAFLEEIPSC